jgi:hypothetical protein
MALLGMFCRSMRCTSITPLHLREDMHTAPHHVADDLLASCTGHLPMLGIERGTQSHSCNIHV